ncbi:Hsp20/alpha crystallin family protein [Flavobacterium sp. UMI-01]|uniref:Hsp20/alpha crystallin family protein n=1 Tax=Flavobacterium sp. UMI-01 TaxID=1441053 RepID=UPI001C7D5304|nr:Hsp20/alpha crystallin family protein [Flavobacterium sp. UMI-01]GIZ07729.1 heat-shock protein [Flavobacterium sp. UMI-01]
MALVRYQNQFPSFFERFFTNELEGWNRNHFSNTNTTLPSVNIRENADAFYVEVAAPGFEKSEFKIEINNDVLTISSEKKINEEIKEDEKITKHEFSYQSFTRSFTLPELVEDDKITAQYENGILSIVIPKKEEAKPKPAKQIEIQ